MVEPLRFAIIGHTNAGKTSLLRTLTRDVNFGEVADRPGTTRHAEAVALRLNGGLRARFIDTPGLEDSVSLLEYLNSLHAESRLARVKRFLQGPEARLTFEQEAKALRALVSDADAAVLVIDTREAVLPKFRAEVEILSCCAKPIMPVLNFVRDTGSRLKEWHAMLLEAGLHARVEFDVVAPFNGAEQRLYSDMATLLPHRRQQLIEIVDALNVQARNLESVAARVVASALIDVAAMRRQLQANDSSDEHKKQLFVHAFQEDVRGHVRKAVEALLNAFAFRPTDAAFTDIPRLAGRWEDDLFNPDLLLQAGRRFGMGAVIGAGVGVVADVALVGLSLGAATALGATVGGAASGGWKPLWRKLENRLAGVQELTVEDSVLLLLADRLLQLARALAQRGHAAQERLTLDDGCDHRNMVSQEWKSILDALIVARSHPQWERDRPDSTIDAERQAIEIALAQRLSDQFNGDRGAT